MRIFPFLLLYVLSFWSPFPRLLEVEFEVGSFKLYFFVKKWGAVIAE